jgi:hypothetical protein
MNGPVNNGRIKIYNVLGKLVRYEHFNFGR